MACREKNNNEKVVGAGQGGHNLNMRLADAAVNELPDEMTVRFTTYFLQSFL